jgi:hypothetical protein
MTCIKINQQSLIIGSWRWVAQRACPLLLCDYDGESVTCSCEAPQAPEPSYLKNMLACTLLMLVTPFSNARSATGERENHTA